MYLLPCLELLLVDCDVNWGSWGACSVTCGGGSQSRKFSIETQSANGGEKCPISPETRDCNIFSCPCQNGILNPGKDVCCPSVCGSCGGIGCDGRPGGAGKCCVREVREKGDICKLASDDGCIIGNTASKMPKIVMFL